MITPVAWSLLKLLLFIERCDGLYPAFGGGKYGANKAAEFIRHYHAHMDRIIQTKHSQ
jgi:hypothetical protein